MTAMGENEVGGMPIAMYATLPNADHEIKFQWTKDGCGSFVVGEVLFVVPINNENEETGRLRFFRPTETIPVEFWGLITASIREEGFSGFPLEVVFNSDGVIQFTVVGRPDINITLTYDTTGLKGDIVGDAH